MLSAQHYFLGGRLCSFLSLPSWMEIQLREGVGTMGHRKYWMKNQEPGGPIGPVSFMTLGKSFDFNEFYDYALTCFFIYIKISLIKVERPFRRWEPNSPGSPGAHPCPRTRPQTGGRRGSGRALQMTPPIRRLSLMVHDNTICPTNVFR